jgi:hypothetical protein
LGFLEDFAAFFASDLTGAFADEGLVDLADLVVFDAGESLFAAMT